MPNIKDVALRAGVSTATVSRVLNMPDKVSQKTVRLVHAAIQELHYDPKDNQSGMTASKSRKILVVIPEFGNIFFDDILAGINEAALRRRYSLLIVATNSLVEREREAMNLLYHHQADGVIFLSPLLNDEELCKINNRFPLVQCCEYSETSALTHVSIDNYAAARDAMELLLQLRHRRIAFLSSTNRFVSTKLREKAYKDALTAHGLEIIPGYVQRGSYSFISGYENMQHLLKLQNRPHAVLAIADTVAAGAMRAIFDVGMRVPEDIVVMGFDNISLCSMLNPTLSTVSQPRTRLGVIAVELLMNKIEGLHEQRSLFLPHELIARGSTKKQAQSSAISLST